MNAIAHPPARVHASAVPALSPDGCEKLVVENLTAPPADRNRPATCICWSDAQPDD
ncbi:hypothetical protein [Embleya sp. NPDC001921]